MKILQPVLLFALFLTLFQTGSSVPAAGASARAKTKVELYYETLCPYSRAFVLDELVPAAAALADYIDVEVIPFGNVRVTDGIDGTPLFTCQHGAAECWGNRIQACAIEIRGVQNPAEGLDYVRCMFEGDAWKDTYNQAPACAKALFGDAVWAQFDACHGSQQGLNLIIANWKRTDALIPAHNYVPWIVIDGVHTEDLQDQAQMNLLPFLCAEYLAGQNIPACSAALKAAAAAAKKPAVAPTENRSKF